MDEDIPGLDSPMLASPAAMMPPTDLPSLPVMAGMFPGGPLGSPVSGTRLPQHSPGGPALPGQSKYAQLLAVIEEMGKDIRPTYAGSKSSAERLKRCIVHARILVRECLVETERSARQ
ncbi:hypothetical protein PR048_003034 [Dryococelus australis]|uniref:Cyclin-dependent kinase 2-associated protein n=1 Tax=Dryococelus australis TaxID=614101 RepID=A0ABQ9INB4_9NEOP|nr:hypothetical protein PR048_003034 [Dryococelus australis]